MHRIGRAQLGSSQPPLKRKVVAALDGIRRVPGPRVCLGRLRAEGEIVAGVRRVRSLVLLSILLEKHK